MHTRIGITEPSNRPDKHMCSCRWNGLTDLDMLDDLTHYGFSQFDASMLLWVWTAQEVQIRLAEWGVI